VRRVAVLVSVIVGSVGCGSSGGPADDGDGGATDARPDAYDEEEDPYCHWDCFGFSECNNNVVTTWEHAPIPCEHWEGECPHAYTWKCQRGCRTDVDEIGPFEDPWMMCEEFRPKHQGDPCTEEAHCRPEGDVWLPDGSLGTDYLTCDVALGACVARPAPEIPDLYATCDLHPTSAPDGSFTGGVVETGLCTGGVCAWFDGATETCILQLCTATCASHGDCPPGTRCDDFYGRQLCLPPDWTAAPIECL
jgi:hypothetical protein